MTITQTVDITDSRRLTIDVPREIPTGRTNVVIQFPIREKVEPTPSIEKATEKPFEKDGTKKIRLTKSMVDELLADETLRSLTGILHTDMTLEEIRTERLAKHL